MTHESQNRRITDAEERCIATLQFCTSKYVLTATNTHTNINELLVEVFSIPSAMKFHREGQWPNENCSVIYCWIEMDVTHKRGGNESREALEDIKAGLEGIAPFLMGDLDMRRAAANYTASAQGQRNELKGTRRKHKRQRGKDDSPSRCVPHSTEHDSEPLCERVPVDPVMDVRGLPSLAPGEEVGDKGLETIAKGCCECHAGSYTGDAGRSVNTSPCAEATLEREQQRECPEQSV
jgi:hypothetical protein